MHVLPEAAGERLVTLAGGAEIGSACADRLDFLTACGRLPHGMPAMGSARKLLGLGQWNTRGLIPPWTL